MARLRAAAVAAVAKLGQLSAVHGAFEPARRYPVCAWATLVSVHPLAVLSRVVQRLLGVEAPAPAATESPMNAAFLITNCVGEGEADDDADSEGDAEGDADADGDAEAEDDRDRLGEGLAEAADVEPSSLRRA